MEKYFWSFSAYDRVSLRSFSSRSTSVAITEPTVEPSGAPSAMVKLASATSHCSFTRSTEMVTVVVAVSGGVFGSATCTVNSYSFFDS